ncbi:hypothetical protein RF11_08798 [Thelohanellus kitauei]|uniref:RNA polymerase II subunit A C-terminal domain phosphatase SSU72 n=1 Tax=Thelohanellus kitauei TaxID=669202 RepID=A0A0C2J4I9_THEKT|nr:hypothetical protein RF11_08798 [Thelohanellus kitauei]
MQFESYESNGVLKMLERNKIVKTNPEKLIRDLAGFRLIISTEEPAFDKIIDCKKESIEEARLGAIYILKICEKAETCLINSNINERSPTHTETSQELDYSIIFRSINSMSDMIIYFELLVGRSVSGHYNQTLLCITLISS